ncbi:Putative secreted beta-glucosidase adg3, partial [Tolypocladium paradoxum]
QLRLRPARRRPRQYLCHHHSRCQRSLFPSCFLVSPLPRRRRRELIAHRTSLTRSATTSHSFARHRRPRSLRSLLLRSTPGSATSTSISGFATFLVLSRLVLFTSLIDLPRDINPETRYSTMKFSIQAFLGSVAAILLSTRGCKATSTHRRLHQLERKFNHHLHASSHSRAEAGLLENVKRGGSCPFPSDDPNLVAITPTAKNAGWAMSPDQECKPGNYCPIACKPGMVMAQWDPEATYSYPKSMNGGLYCDKDGKIRKPFPNKPNCVRGTGTVKAVNKCKSQMSWCQTVMPGNEAMIIPTVVDSEATIAVPDPDYFCKTGAHFYINPPGTDAKDCIWGKESEPVGNWSPFVAGTITDANGQTFVNLGWNPMWESSALKSNGPGFGVKIECPDGGCNGLPCQIDPSGGGKVGSALSAIGAGDSAFCVVTVAKGKTANIVAFDGSGGGGGSQQPSSKTETPTPQPTTTQQPTTSSTPTPTTTSTSSTPTTTSTSSVPTTTSQAPTTSSTAPPTTTSQTSQTGQPTLLPGIFHENGTTSSVSEQKSSSISPEFVTETTSNSAPKTTEKKGEAGRQQGGAAVAGLVVAFIAATCLF